MNVSKIGCFIRLPVNPEICKGQEVEINFPRTIPLAAIKGQYARLKRVKIMRVDFERFGTAEMGIGLHFL